MTPLRDLLKGSSGSTIYFQTEIFLFRGVHRAIEAAALKNPLAGVFFTSLHNLLRGGDLTSVAPATI